MSDRFDGGYHSNSVVRRALGGDGVWKVCCIECGCQVVGWVAESVFAMRAVMWLICSACSSLDEWSTCCWNVSIFQATRKPPVWNVILGITFPFFMAVKGDVFI